MGRNRPGRKILSHYPSDNPRLVQWISIDKNMIMRPFDHLARQADNSCDVLAATAATGQPEDDDVASARGTVCSPTSRKVSIADLQRRLHIRADNDH
jgi:hypothetical protein